MSAAAVDAFAPVPTAAARVIRSDWSARFGAVALLGVTPAHLDHALTGPLTDARAAVAAGFGRCRTLTLDALVDELTACERTLSARFGGIGAAAVDAVRDASGQTVSDWLAVYAVTDARIADQWPGQVATQLRAAAARREDRDAVTARFVSPTPLRVPGCSGRGIAVRFPDQIVTGFTSALFGGVESLRLAAFAAFNAAHAAR